MESTPDQQWWTINGADIIIALERAHEGVDPAIVYADLMKASHLEDYTDENQFRLDLDGPE